MWDTVIMVTHPPTYSVFTQKTPDIHTFSVVDVGPGRR